MEFHEALKEELLLPLPGMDAQIKMAPKNRKLDLISKRMVNAAVSLVIIPSSESKLELILIKRTEYHGHHSGQVSLPGGKEEPADESLLQTAMRETHEEIGIRLTPDNLIGSLTPLFIPISRFMVYPFIFIKKEKQDFTLDPAEVEYIIQYPVHKLLDDSIIRITDIQAGEQLISAPYYAVGKEIVWGATAMILSEFIEIIYRVERKNPGHFRTGF